MKYRYGPGIFFVGLFTILFALCLSLQGGPLARRVVTKPVSTPVQGQLKTIIVAGGCFWSVESDLEKLTGVVVATAGYTDGTTEYPTYENYVEGGHREAVKVTYDTAQLSYENIVEYVTKHSDPTDRGGSFHDRGMQYAPAIYYETPEEKRSAEEVLAKIGALRAYADPIATNVLMRSPFWPAEEYHQGYARKNPLQYAAFRRASGRSEFIEEHWGENQNTLFTKKVSWISYQRPSGASLHAILTPLQYEVTQKSGTERPYSSSYDKSKEEGIYVDLLSGEPLFSSADKFDSGTGWPSFTKPITSKAVKYVEDNELLSPRTEVRSVYADSHLGHVFDDGPSDRGGKRYCMNGAALRFIPKEEMEEKGYGMYLGLFP